MAQRNVLKENLAESARVVRERIGDRRLEVGMILGSGLGPLAERIEDAVYVPYGEVPHMRTSTATSHVGRFVCGMLGGKRVLAMQGRLHGYEGNTAQEVAYPVWLMHELGVDTLFATNAAGAINESYRVGDFCIIEDHINFTGRNPVAGLEPDGIAFRFFSMLDAYDPALRRLARETADELGIRVQEGVYLGLLGPSFETPAEIRAFRACRDPHVPLVGCRHGGHERVRGGHRGATHRDARAGHVAGEQHGLRHRGRLAHRRGGARRGARSRGRLRAPGHRHRGAHVGKVPARREEPAPSPQSSNLRSPSAMRPARRMRVHTAQLITAGSTRHTSARPAHSNAPGAAAPASMPATQPVYTPMGPTRPCPRPRQGRSAAGRTRRWQAAR